MPIWTINLVVFIQNAAFNEGAWINFEKVAINEESGIYKSFSRLSQYIPLFFLFIGTQELNIRNVWVKWLKTMNDYYRGITLGKWLVSRRSINPFNWGKLLKNFTYNPPAAIKHWIQKRQIIILPSNISLIWTFKTSLIFLWFNMQNKY